MPRLKLSAHDMSPQVVGFGKLKIVPEGPGEGMKPITLSVASCITDLGHN